MRKTKTGRANRSCSGVPFILGIALVVLGPASESSRAQDVDERRPPSGEVAQAIELSTGYLERSCGPEGKFAYKVEVGTGHETSSYDIIRHEGSIYALAMANSSRPDPRVVETMVRAAGFLRDNYMGPGFRPGQLVVWSKLLTEGSDRQYAELGGASLGLVALAAVREVSPKSVPLSDLQGLGRFVLFLQKNDGSFIHKYRRDGGPIPDWESLYYPGEAALGLLALYEADHSNEWLLAAARALSYLTQRRARLATVPADHWALIASAKLFPYIDQVQSVISREALVQHAIQICDSIVKDQFRGSAPVGIDGAFDVNGRTAPSATRLEGLLAALEFLPKSELRDRIETVTNKGIAFLLRSQIVSGPQAGGVPGAVVVRARDSSEIRIDYVQHSLCAWLHYEQWLEHGRVQSPR